ncbi:MAG TPA: hypothetical protein VGO09_00160, partial [Flavisolibacter sp.]|nr:hypothetical protein [Flavisolibacter sp.]
MKSRIKKTDSIIQKNPSFEYKVLASSIIEQYQDGGHTQFEKMLAIPQSDRIPALAIQFGYSQIIHLLKKMIREFIAAIPSTEEKIYTDKAIEGYAFDIYLIACIDFLSLEDIILFFENTKAGKYGQLSPFTPYKLLELLNIYLQERHLAYIAYKEKVDEKLKMNGPG